MTLTQKCSAMFTPKFMIIFLTTVNMLNYLDRGIVPGAPNKFEDFIEKSLDVTKTGSYFGALTSVFIVGYTIAALIFGYMVKFTPPMIVIAHGLVIHTVAVFASGLAKYSGSYWVLIVARCFSGVGEAAFCTIGPALVDDRAPPRLKGIWLGIFFSAIPVGTAIGYVYGGNIARILGWEWAFFIEAILFVPPTIFCYFLGDIALAMSEGVPMEVEAVAPNGEERDSTRALSATIRDSFSAANQKQPVKRNVWKEVALLCKSNIYVLMVLGQAAYSAVLAGVSAFGPGLGLSLGFFDGSPSADRESLSSTFFGGVTAVAGLVGAGLGGYLVDKFGGSTYTSKMKNALRVLAISCTGGVALLLIIPWMKSKWAFFGILLLGLTMLLGSTSPLTIAIFGSIPQDTRPFATALQTFMIHAIGDVPSPIIIGAIRDALAPPETKDPIEDGRYNEEGVKGIQLTIFITLLWLVWTVICWVGAYFVFIYEQRRLAKTPAENNKLNSAVLAPFQSTATPLGEIVEPAKATVSSV